MGHLMGHLIPNYSILRKASRPNIDITLSMNILKYDFIKIASLTRPRKDQHVALCVWVLYVLQDLKMSNENENENKR